MSQYGSRSCGLKRNVCLNYSFRWCGPMRTGFFQHLHILVCRFPTGSQPRDGSQVYLQHLSRESPVLLSQKFTETVLSHGSSPVESMLRPPPRKQCHVMFCFSWGHTTENGVPTERSISKHQLAVGQFPENLFQRQADDWRRLWLNIGDRAVRAAQSSLRTNCNRRREPTRKVLWRFRCRRFGSE